MTLAAPHTPPPLRTGRPRPSPLRRPSPLVRAGIGVAALLMLAFNAALMTADRAPRLIKFVLGDIVRALSDRIDAGGRVDVRDARPLAGDATVHIGLWFAVVVLVALTIWSWRGLAATAVGVFLVSVAVELGQGRYSTTRSVERSDVFFNGVGVALGVLAAAAIFTLWDRAARR